MNAAAVANMKPKNEFYSGPARVPFVLSVILHVALFVFMTVGVPFMKRDIKPPEELIMTVELVDIADVAQTDIVDEPQKSDLREDTPELPKPKPVYNNNPNQIPELAIPEEPEIDDSVPEPPKDKPKAEPKKVKPPPKPQSKPKPPKRPKPRPVPKKEEPKEEARNITSLMNDLLADENEEQQETPQPQNTTNTGGQTSQVAQLSDQVLRTMEADLNAGIRGCWNVDAGGKDAKTQIVELQVYVNRDRTVRAVEFKDRLRYDTDKNYRAAAEAARNALLNRFCWPLRLPEDKYDVWKSFPYTFDPSGMI